MIELTRLNGKKFVLNCELIETIDNTPDTIITLTNNKKYVVKNETKEVIEKIVIYKKNIMSVDGS